MKEIQPSDRAEWRSWLSRNHHRVTEGVWLVFLKKSAVPSALSYGEAVEEALCFGWIDSVLQKIDARRYRRKFTPRRPGSRWSALNRRRAKKLIADGRMTRHGMAEVEIAKRDGHWQSSPPEIGPEFPPEFAEALSRSPRAAGFFESLAPSYRLQFIGWIGVAKRSETRQRRIRESIALLERGQKLGMK